jgi:hypothetical protein
LVTFFVEVFAIKDMGGSQSMSDEGTKYMEPTKKCPKIALGAISSFFGSKTFKKKQDEAHKLFMEDLVLFLAKGYFSLNTCENV